MQLFATLSNLSMMDRVCNYRKGGGYFHFVSNHSLNYFESIRIPTNDQFIMDAYCCGQFSMNTNVLFTLWFILFNMCLYFFLLLVCFSKYKKSSCMVLYLIAVWSEENKWNWLRCWKASHVRSGTYITAIDKWKMLFCFV